MGIQINGNTDIISATDGSLSIQGADLGSVSANPVTIGTGASVSSPATNVLTLGTNSAERIRINSSGSVGIGTDIPGSYDSGGRTLVISENSTLAGMTIRSSNQGAIYFADGLTGNEAYRGRIEYSHSADSLNFGTAGTGSKLTLTSAGAVQIANGNLVFSTAGTGIDFSASGNAGGMTSELLDDYEEGTWTPVLVSRSSPSGSLSYTQNTGKYVKVGDLVYVSAFVTWNSGSIGGSTVQLSGLPFIAGANRERGGLQITYSASGWVSGATIYQQCFRSETNETNAIYNFSDATDGKIDSTIAGSQIASTGEFMVTGTYCI